MDQLTPTEEKIVDILLEEYRQSSGEIKLRLGFQQNLTNYQIAAIGVVAAASSQFFDDTFLQLQASSFFRYILLLTPFVFLLFSSAHNTHDLMIIHHARYINHVVAPEIRRVTGTISLLGADRYLHEERQNLLGRHGIMPLVGQEFAFHYLIPVIFFALFATSFASVDWPFISSWAALEWGIVGQYAILCIGILLYIFTITMRIRVGQAYLGLTSK